MRLSDLTPLVALIVACLSVIAIVVLLLAHLSVPPALSTVAISAAAAFQVTSGSRGSAPPPRDPPGDKPHA